MKKVKKALLGAVTFCFPVVLAACYGPPSKVYDENQELDQVPPNLKSGKVIDAGTKSGIPGIRVSCLVEGTEYGSTVSGADGAFSTMNMPACQSLSFTDVDEGDNGGRYGARSVPSEELAAECLVELNKAE